jgi:hypothetical protein
MFTSATIMADLCAPCETQMYSIDQSIIADLS